MKAALAAMFTAASISTSAAAFQLKMALDVLSAVNRLNLFAPASLVVTADGTGETMEAAKQAALLSATQQATGALVVAERASEGDALTRDQVIQYSAGIVSSYDVQSCQLEAARYRCTIKATVSSEQIHKRLKTASADQDVDGDSLYAQHVSTQARIVEGRKLASYMIGSLKSAGVDVAISDVSLKPNAGQQAMVKVDLQLSLNDSYIDSIKQVMSKLSADSVRMQVDDREGALAVLTEWTDRRYPIYDNQLVASIASSMRAQQVLDIRIRALDDAGNLLASGCQRYRPSFYGASIFEVPTTEAERFAARHPPSSARQDPTIRADHSEQLSVVLPMEPESAKQMKSMTATIGCT